MRCGGPDPSRDREVSRPPGQRLVSIYFPMQHSPVRLSPAGASAIRPRVLACAAIAQAEMPVEGPSELREVSRWFGTGRSRGSAARQVEWLPRVEGEEVRFMQIWPAVSGAS